jgi:hypothetical protein
MHHLGTMCRGGAMTCLGDWPPGSRVMEGASQDLSCRPGLEPGPNPGEMFEARGLTSVAKHIRRWL